MKVGNKWLVRGRKFDVSKVYETRWYGGSPRGCVREMAFRFLLQYCRTVPSKTYSIDLTALIMLIHPFCGMPDTYDRRVLSRNSNDRYYTDWVAKLTQSRLQIPVAYFLVPVARSKRKYLYKQSIPYLIQTVYSTSHSSDFEILFVLTCTHNICLGWNECKYFVKLLRFGKAARIKRVLACYGTLPQKTNSLIFRQSLTKL